MRMRVSKVFDEHLLAHIFHSSLALFLWFYEYESSEVKFNVTTHQWLCWRESNLHNKQKLNETFTNSSPTRMIRSSQPPVNL